MDDFKDSAMIALLPDQADWCKIDLPHMTLVYAGEIQDLNPGDFNKLAKDAASIAMLSGPFSVRVTGVEVFGDETKVDVFRLSPTQELQAMRNFVEDWNASEFPFRPHVTIGPVGSAPALPPECIRFDRVCVGYGRETLTFWLKTY